MTSAARALRAATRPLHLLPLGVGVVVGGGLIALGLPPLALLAGGLSLATWGALAGWELLGTPPPDVPVGPDRAGLRSAVLREALQRVDAAARRVSDRLTAQDGLLAASFVDLAADLRALVEQAEALAARGDAVHAYLRDHDPATIERERDRCLASARAAADPAAADSFRAAAEAKRRQLDALRELHGVLDRVVAEVAAVEATLGALDARVVRLAVDDPAEALRAGADAGDEIRAARERVGRWEQAAARTLREMG